MTDMARITVHIDSPEPTRIGPEGVAAVIETIHRVREQAGNLTADEAQQIGPEVILLLRDVAPHLIAVPIVRHDALIDLWRTALDLRGVRAKRTAVMGTYTLDPLMRALDRLAEVTR